MRKNLSKLIGAILVMPTMFAFTSCSNNKEPEEVITNKEPEEEVITEADDTKYLDTQTESAKTVPEGYPDPNTTDGKAIYDSFKSGGLDTAGRPNVHDHGDGWTAWGDNEAQKSTLPNKEGKYYLTNDVLLTNTWSAPGTHVNICLNGHTISITEQENKSVMYLNTFAWVEIYDCSTVDTYLKVVKNGAWKVLGVNIPAPEGNIIEIEDYNLSTPDGAIVHTIGGCITGGTYCGIRIDRNVYFSACSLYVHGGNIVGNRTPDCGGGVNFGDSASRIDGGVIAGNYSEKSGGGVALHGPANKTGETPQFTMNGGMIIGNYCKNYGAGIFCNDNFKTVLNAGLIKANKCPEYGGGIYTSTKRGFTVNGDDQMVFDGNESLLGGAIYSNSGSSFTINGCVMKNNKAVNGGGLYAGKTGTINNVTITNNTASGNRGGGGGIYFRSTADVTINNATVTNNVANYGGALDISNGAKVRIYGGTYTNNTAKKLGGGACVVAGGVLALGGSAVISSNNLNGKVNNVYLPSGVCISVGDGTTNNPSLSSGANIGISLEKLPGSGESVKFSNNGNSNDASFFKVDSDDSALSIASENSCLNIRKS